jgi:aspartate racemase
VAEQAARERRGRIGILGTRYTMEGPVYPRALGARGLDYEVPDAADRETVNAIIFEELVNGVFVESSRRKYVEVIERLRDRGCDAVALVCTEIPLLVKAQDSPLPTLPSTTLLAHAALEVALGKRPFPTWRGGPPAASTPR